MEEPLLDVRDLNTRFLTDDGVVRAVNGVSFTVAPGERVALVGESGSGKSVTALSIMRLIDPPAGRIVRGSVLFRGRDLLRLSERRMRSVRGGEIGMIFQDPMSSLDPVFTVGDQLIETIRVHRARSRRDARKLAIDMLAAVGIAQPARRLADYPHQFSGGMRQRLAIALVLAGEPALVIADEPTTALDVTTQSQILELLKRLTEEHGTAAILISHDLAVVAGFCERVNVMYAGRIVETGKADDVFMRPLHPYTWGLLGSIARLDAPATRRLQAIAGAPPSLLSSPRGCPFHPRCEFADDRSVAEMPALRPLEDGHAVACHHAHELALAKRR